jgi:hypothetical protein
VRGEHRVEQPLVPVLQRAQVDVAVEVAGEPVHLRPAAADLLLQGLHRLGQQAQQAVAVPFLVGERGALRAVRVRQQPPSSFHTGSLP